MGNVLVKEETMTAIAESIRSKHGSTNLYKPREMPEAIDTIPVGDGPSEDDPIRFYGLERKLLCSYSLEEVMVLTELPAIPESKGLIAQGWNWTLESIQNLGREVDVGAIYITDDGSTRIYISLIENQLSPILGFAQEDANDVLVDWGDGSELETTEQYGYASPVNMSHTYAEPGDYVIRLIPQSESSKIYFLGDSKGAYLLRKVDESSYGNYVYMEAVKKIEIGKRVKLSQYGFSYTGIKSIVVPEDIINMDAAFYSCLSLEYLAIPKSVTSLASSLTNRCYRLKTVSVPDTLKSTGTYCFAYNYCLKTITLPDTVTMIWGYMLTDCYQIKKISIPQGVTSVGTAMCRNCYALEDVDFHNGIVYLDGSVFESCKNLKKIVLPDSVTQLGSSVFNSCSGLRELKLPNSLETIVATAVRGCYALSEITIPAKVVSIGAAAFSGNYGVDNYYILSTTPPTLAGENVFLNIPETCKIHVPKGCLEAYQAAEYWSTYADYMVEMEDEDEETE